MSHQLSSIVNTVGRIHRVQAKQQSRPIYMLVNTLLLTPPCIKNKIYVILDHEGEYYTYLCKI